MSGPRQRREGWPWPSATPDVSADQAALDEAQALVNTNAYAVAELSEALQRALRRLQESQVEVRVAAACVAAREADAAIAKARQPAD